MCTSQGQWVVEDGGVFIRRSEHTRMKYCTVVVTFRLGEQHGRIG